MRLSICYIIYVLKHNNQRNITLHQVGNALKKLPIRYPHNKTITQKERFNKSEVLRDRQ